MKDAKIISLALVISILMSCMSNIFAFAEDKKDISFDSETQANEGVPAQPAEKSLVNDKKQVKFDTVIQDNNYEVCNDFYAQKRFLSDILLKDENAVLYLHNKYQQRFGDISAQNKMAEIFVSEELDALLETNKLFSIEDMYMLYILCINDVNMTDDLSEEMKSLLLLQNSIYSVLLAYLNYQRTGEGCIGDYIVNDENNQNIELLSDSQTGSSYELYNQKKYENKYYQPLDGGLSIGDVTGNVVYTHTPVSVSGKNGFDMTLTATYNSSKAMGIRYEWEEGDDANFGPGFRVSVDGNLFGTGWNFNVTHIVEEGSSSDKVMLEDGRIMPIEYKSTKSEYEFDDIKVISTGVWACCEVKYLNGTTEYIKDKYIYKKTDKYGNSIYYEYDNPENIHNVTTQSSVRLQKNLTKVYDDIGRTINIDYYDNKVVITRPDASTVEYFRDKIHVDGVGKAEKLSISDDIPVITGIYDRASQISYCDLEYTTSEICFYHGNIGGGFYALFYGLYIVPSRFRPEHGPDYTFTYTESFYEKPKYGMGLGSYNVSVKSLNIDNKPCKEYSYSTSNDNLKNWTQKTTSVTSDNLVTEFLNNSRDNSYAVNTYVRQGDADILRKEMVHNSKYEYMLSQPTDVTLRQYNSNGNYIEQKTTYEYNTHGQPIKEVTTIDGEEYQTKEYQYSDNVYSSLLDEAVKKSGRTVYNVIYNVEMLLKNIYTIFIDHIVIYSKQFYMNMT